MSKMVICKNCGGEFSDELDKCPYCNTMHKKGAYKKFRFKIRDIIDQLLGLKVEAERSVSKIIFSSIFRALLISLVIIGIAFLLSLFSNVNYLNDKEYDQKRLEDIIWENDNISILEEAYKNNDFETIDRLYYENSSVVYNWKHFSLYNLKSQHKSIMTEPYFAEYALRNSLYFIFNPNYFININNMPIEDYQEYEKMRQEIIDKLIGLGYSESELQKIYDSHKDSYGYVNASDLRKYLKGDNNG